MYRDFLESKEEEEPPTVLILVLLECIVTQSEAHKLYETARRLNPCFIGMYRDMELSKIIGKNPYRLNPCFIGMYRDSFWRSS